MNNDIADGLGLPPLPKADQPLAEIPSAPPPPPPPPTPTPEPVSSGLPPLEPIAPPPPSPEANEPLAQKADQPPAELPNPSPVISEIPSIPAGPTTPPVIPTEVEGSLPPIIPPPTKKVNKKLIFGGTLVLLLLGGALALAAQLGLFRGDLRQKAGGCDYGETCHDVDLSQWEGCTSTCNKNSCGCRLVSKHVQQCSCNAAPAAPAATSAPASQPEAPTNTGGGGCPNSGEHYCDGFTCPNGGPSYGSDNCYGGGDCENRKSVCGTAPVPTTASGTGGGGGGGGGCSGADSHPACKACGNPGPCTYLNTQGVCAVTNGNNCSWNFATFCTSGEKVNAGGGKCRTCNSDGASWTDTGNWPDCSGGVGGSTPTVAPQNYNSCTTLGAPCTTDTGTGNCRATGAQNGGMYCQVTITSAPTPTGIGGSCTADGKSGTCTADAGSCSGAALPDGECLGSGGRFGTTGFCCILSVTCPNPTTCPNGAIVDLCRQTCPMGTGGSCTAGGKTGVCTTDPGGCSGSSLLSGQCPGAGGKFGTTGYCCVPSAGGGACNTGETGGFTSNECTGRGGVFRIPSGGSSTNGCCTVTSVPTPTGTATCTCDYCQKIGSSGPATCTGGIKQASRSNCAASASLCAATPTPGGPPSCPGLGSEGKTCRVPQNCNNAPNCDGGLICDGGICVKPPPGTCGSGPSGCRVHNCSVCSNYGGGLDECRSGGTVTDCASAKLSGSCGQIDLLDAKGDYCGVMQQACTGSCAGGVTTMAGGGAPAAGGGGEPPVGGGTQSPTGTVPPGGTAAACVATRLYLNGSTTPATAAQIASLQIGNTIRLAVRGNQASFTKGRFVIKLNNSVLTTQETTTKQNLPGDAATFEFIYDYTITQGGNYSIEGSIWQ